MTSDCARKALYKNGYKDAVSDIVSDLLTLRGFHYESTEGEHKLIINVVDLMCIFKKYGAEFVDGFDESLSGAEIEKLSKTEVIEKIL